MSEFTSIYPLRFEPIYRSYVWGEELWVLSDRPDGMSLAANGPLKGKALHDLLSLELVGRSVERFPLLVKIIDARESLSIQVHPDERSAAQFGGEPKTEAWIALKRSRVLAGLKPGVTQETFARAIAQKTAEVCLVPHILEEGDAMLIPAGTVHAICGASRLLEVQQNSNTTYRLYDWGREGRQLHLREGFASIHWEQPAPIPLKRPFRLSCPFFHAEERQIEGHWEMPPLPTTCQILFCTRGEGEMVKELLRPEVTYLLPAARRECSIQGNCHLIRAFLP